MRGTISSFCGYRTNTENIVKHKELVGKLLGAGFSVTTIRGTYIENYKAKNAKEVNELSLIVFDHKHSGKLLNALKKFGTEFEQDSITFAEAGGDYYLIGLCDKNKVKNEKGELVMSDTYPGKNKEIKLGKPMFGENGEFFSKINSRPFVFKEEAERVDEKAERSQFSISALKAMHYMTLETLAEEELA